MPKDLVPSRGAPDTFSVNAARFARQETLDDIRAAAEQAVEWLRQNKASIDAYGLTNERKPWFDEDAYGAPLPHKMAEKERHCTLDAQVYEHGIAKFAFALSECGVIDLDPDDPKALVLLRSGEVEGWFHVLVRYSWKNISMNLEEFKNTGDYHPGTPQSHAKSKLEALSELGFVVVTKKKSFDIKAGPVAKTFYEDVWYPISEEFQTKICKWREDEK